jgi:hypothetical protein
MSGMIDLIKMAQETVAREQSSLVAHYIQRNPTVPIEDIKIVMNQTIGRTEIYVTRRNPSQNKQESTVDKFTKGQEES